eukprot:TRINITY_DN5532_c0_g1_i1.p1 TRINITY_DN5532_c0_g1~~TRINITY_DN5532_c0_g1_i1.p1  ORF type:complete len:300 (-),score=31.29 TRINITY_DN5532_c0_g1_i1:112-1011(-)
MDCGNGNFQPNNNSDATQCEECTLGIDCEGCSTETGLCNSCSDGLRPSGIDCVVLPFNKTVIVQFEGVSAADLENDKEAMKQTAATALGIPVTRVQIIITTNKDGVIEGHITLFASTQAEADKLADKLVDLINSKKIDQTSSFRWAKTTFVKGASAAQTTTNTGPNGGSVGKSGGFIAAIILGVVFAVLAVIAVAIAAVILKKKYDKNAYLKSNSVSSEMFNLSAKHTIRSQLTPYTSGGIIARPAVNPNAIGGTIKATPRSPTAPHSARVAPAVTKTITLEAPQANNTVDFAKDVEIL